MFPLLEYLDGLIEADKISYSSKDVAAARLSLLRPTHMVDYAVDTYKSVHGDSAEIPAEMEEQKTQVFKQLEELESGCKPLTDLCNNEEEKVCFFSKVWLRRAVSCHERLSVVFCCVFFFSRFVLDWHNKCVSATRVWRVLCSSESAFFSPSQSTHISLHYFVL